MARNPLEIPAAATPVVVVHTPTGRDGVLVAELLSSHGYVIRRTVTSVELAAEIGETVGVILLAEEALHDATAPLLLDYLAAQPSWSDLPIVILTAPVRGSEARRGPLAEFLEQSNVTLLERPVQPVTLLSAVHAALRARTRQYQVRTYLAERARAEEQERRRQRIESIGNLAGGVAHEVNNMLAVMLGFSAMAIRQLPADHPAVADLGEVVRAGERAAQITQQLLTFSRQQPNQPTLLSLSGVVQELSKLLHQSVGLGHELVLDLPGDVPEVRADRTQVEQVVINLVLNARDATPAGGRIAITAGATELDADYRARHMDVTLQPGPYAMLAVTDTGRGMDRATIDRAFEPFYTTKAVGQGTGLGLSTVYGIVKQAGGYVWIYSEPGEGTTVKVYLPAVGTAEHAALRPAAADARGHERILVVEDEAMVRRMACHALEDHGYTVLEAADGQAALEVLTSARPPVDLILCDIAMPRLSGPLMGAALAEGLPQMPILFMSGYPRHEVIRRGLLSAEVPFIQKPFRAADVAAMVRSVLDAAAAAPSLRKT